MDHATRRSRGLAAIPVARRRYENWAGVVTADGLWTATARDPGDVVAILA
jgi:hypothetical protein